MMFGIGRFQQVFIGVLIVEWFSRFVFLIGTGDADMIDCIDFQTILKSIIVFGINRAKVRAN